MVEIKGKLSSLFDRGEIHVELTEDLLESIINRPITKDNKCIGIIKSVDKENDEWTGFLFDTVAAGLSMDMKYCASVSLLSL